MTRNTHQRSILAPCTNECTLINCFFTTTANVVEGVGMLPRGGTAILEATNKGAKTRGQLPAIVHLIAAVHNETRAK
jgi:hypothetical protein